MGERTPIQQSFAYGEISPRLAGRTYSDRYQQSLKTCRNAVTYSHGAAVKRPGTRYLGLSQDEGTDNRRRLVRFQPKTTQPYVLELGDSFVSLWDRNGFTNQTFVTPYAADELADLQFELSTRDLSMVFVHQNHPPHEFRLVDFDLETNPPVWQQITFTAQPGEWGPGYPGSVTFFQQRLWLAGTPDASDTVWASKVNDFYDLTVGALADDAIEFEMSDRGDIQWIKGTRDLLIGCDTGEYVMQTSDAGGAYVPGELSVRQQSSYGSARIQPAEAYNGVLYVNGDRRRIRFMSYQFLEEGWISTDLTWPSEHVTSAGITEIHYVQGPDPLIWLLLGNGAIATAIYERDQDNLIGWHQHNTKAVDSSPPGTPGDFIYSMAVTQEMFNIEAWWCVQRFINGTAEMYIERTEGGTLDDLRFDEARFLCDSAVIREVDSRLLANGNTEYYLEQMEHLEGRVVQITSQWKGTEDNQSAQVLLTVDDGEVILPNGFFNVDDQCIVGLQYIGFLLTLPLEQLVEYGTAQATLKRYNKIFLRLLTSTIPEVHGQVTPARLPSRPMGLAPLPFTGDIQVGSLGWDRDAQVLIEMPLAKNYTILAIFGEASAHKL